MGEIVPRRAQAQKETDVFSLQCHLGDHLDCALRECACGCHELEEFWA